MEQLQQLERLLKNLTPVVPLTRAIWSINDIAEYLRVTPRQVRDRVSLDPTFPTPRRMPSPKDKGSLRWQAIEVIEWWEKRGTL